MEYAGLPNARITAHILAEINVIRTILELPPVRSILKGRRLNSDSCPINRTLSYKNNIRFTVYGTRILIHGKNVLDLKYYPSISNFILYFDLGGYPNMVLKD